MKISKIQAKNFLINYHYLSKKQLVGKEGIKTLFNRIQTIQFDPLNQVGFNSHLVLQSRINNYQKSMLDELLYQDRYLIDHWDKNMSIIKTTDFPYFKRVRDITHIWYRRDEEIVSKYLNHVREFIKENGPVSSKEIDLDAKVNWYWQETRVAKVALETMFYWGEIGVHHKEKSIRYFDYLDRLIDSSLLVDEDPFKEDIEYYKYIFLRRLRSVGLIKDKAGEVYVGIYFMKSPQRRQAIKELLEEEKIIKIQIEGINSDFYIEPEYKELFNTTLENNLVFLAPLDNILWDRTLIKELFNFDYIWEVYKPLKERKYGYYVLPILYNGNFVARFEPKLSSDKKTLEIINFYVEDNFEIDNQFISDFNNELSNFINYLNIKNYKIDFRKFPYLKPLN